MDQPQSATPEDSARISVTPDMRALGAGSQTAGERLVSHDKSFPADRPLGRLPILLGAAGLALGLAALALSTWTQVEGKREILRLSTELAQLKVSLDLYARGNQDSASLADLGNRISALEETASNTSVVPLPVAAAPTAPAATASSEDCLPVGMRLLVAAGDSYLICERDAEVAVSFVDNGYITLSDGTSVASGGMTPLPGQPACNLAVTSGGDEGLTGYAEIRVTC